MAAAAARSNTPSGVPAPRVAAFAFALLLLLVCAPCGGGARPVREGRMSAATTSRARVSPALDVGRWVSGSVATAAGARNRVATVRGGAPTPPSGPSQNHN